MQVDATTGLGLRRIQHADAIAGDDPQQVSLVLPLPASRAHSDRPAHDAYVTDLSEPQLDGGGVGAVSGRMSIRQPVSRAARRAF